MLVTCFKGAWRDAIVLALGRPSLISGLLMLSILDAFMLPMLRTFEAAHFSATHDMSGMHAVATILKIVIPLCVLPILSVQAIRHTVWGAQRARARPVLDGSFRRYFRLCCAALAIAIAVGTIGFLIGILFFSCNRMSAERIYARGIMAAAPCFMLLAFFYLRYSALFIKTALDLPSDLHSAWTASRGKFLRIAGVHLLTMLPLLLVALAIYQTAAPADPSAAASAITDASAPAPVHLSPAVNAVLTVFGALLYGSTLGWIHKTCFTRNVPHGE
jgi:hypothetical protein